VDLVTSPVAVLGSAAVATSARRAGPARGPRAPVPRARAPHRRRPRGSRHVGDVHGIGAQTFRDLLDGPLALRNVHKAQPLVTLPLAVGVAWAVSTLQARAARRKAEGGMRFGLVAQGPALIAIGLVIAAVAAAAAPAWTGAITRGRSYTELPAYWRETADWLGLAALRGAPLVPATASAPSGGAGRRTSPCSRWRPRRGGCVTS
jgi:hypothetical protein